MNSNLKVYDEKMNKSVDMLAKDYAAIRAGRANPGRTGQGNRGILRRSHSHQPDGGGIGNRSPYPRHSALGPRAL